MSKNAAKEAHLGALHDHITRVFTKVLARYEARIDAVDAIDPEEVEDEVLRELLDTGAEPNPAMLSAITKFLKDNDITMDTEALDELSSQERRLQERRAKRQNLVNLTDLRVQSNG